jgi:hypothetical protein
MKMKFVSSYWKRLGHPNTVERNGIERRKARRMSDTNLPFVSVTPYELTSSIIQRKTQGSETLSKKGIQFLVGPANMQKVVKKIA